MRIGVADDGETWPVSLDQESDGRSRIYNLMQSLGVEIGR